MKKLFIFWVGTSKGGNTMLMLSETETIERERKVVKVGKKTYNQIILAGEDGAAAERKDRVTYYILLEGNVAGDFTTGQSLDCELTETVISKNEKGTLMQALLK